MPRASVDASALIDWGVAASALPGQAQSGDSHLVKAVATGVLVAVVDGLGHGTEAATAARTAVNTLDEHASESVLALLERCHVALKGSRGVVMSRAFANGHQNALTWAGVGNVDCMLFHVDAAARAKPSRDSLVTRGGIVGSELPPVRAGRAPGPRRRAHFRHRRDPGRVQRRAAARRTPATARGADPEPAPQGHG